MIKKIGYKLKIIQSIICTRFEEEFYVTGQTNQYDILFKTIILIIKLINIVLFVFIIINFDKKSNGYDKIILHKPCKGMDQEKIS